ncbi:MAG: SPOR domain-containing protein, partial [Cellvibrionales bacterium]|nr:SPOR domain-containing protein [Cellvibrionales bacterium]
WDIHEDMKREKIETIKTIKKRSKPFSEPTDDSKKANSVKTTDAPAKKQPIIRSPSDIINNMATSAKATSNKPLVFRRKPGKKRTKKITAPPRETIKQPTPKPTEPPADTEVLAQPDTMIIPEKQDLPDYLQATPVQGPAQVRAVDIKPEKIEKKIATTSTNQGHYVLHVGSYQEMRNALKSQSSLYEAGFPVYIRSATVHGKEYHRVFVGPNLSLDEVTRFEKELKPIMPVKRYPSTHRFAQ